MTTTQVQYWTLQETKRHNLVTEDVQQGTLQENIRHNVATEDISRQNLSEVVRHNVATEQISRDNLSELNRHNVATEKQALKDLSEVTRHNKRVEKETTRHNKAEESIGKRNAKSSERQAGAAERNAASNAKNASTNAKRIELDYKRLAVDTLVAQADISKKEAEKLLTEKKTANYELELLTKSGVVGDTISAILLMGNDELYDKMKDVGYSGSRKDFDEVMRKAVPAWDKASKKSASGVNQWFKSVDRNLTKVILNMLGIPPDNWDKYVQSGYTTSGKSSTKSKAKKGK